MKKVIFGVVALATLFAMHSPMVGAQYTASSTANSTVMTTSTSTPATSTTITIPNQIVLLQTQIVILVGKLVAQLQSYTGVDSQVLRTLQLGWIGLAQNQITLLRAKFNL